MQRINFQLMFFCLQLPTNETERILRESVRKCGMPNEGKPTEINLEQANIMIRNFNDSSLTEDRFLFGYIIRPSEIIIQKLHRVKLTIHGPVAPPCQLHFRTKCLLRFA